MFCCNFWTWQVYYGKSETSLLWDNLYRLCTKLKYNKAPGLDRLPPELFKMLNQELVGFLTSLYNMCILSQVLVSGMYYTCLQER